jgi:hypothetical protein
MSSPASVINNKSEPRSSLRMSSLQDGGVLLDLEHDRLLKLNPVGVEIWKLLSVGESEPRIVQEIAERYGVDNERVERDVRALLIRIAELQVPMSSSVSTSQSQPITQREKRTSYPWYGHDPTAARPKPKTATVFFALAGLAIFDLILWLFSLKSLCYCVNKWPLRQYTDIRPDATGRVCGAVDKACVWYPKRALCLQRSAVTTCLLRSCGISARMMIGVRPMPFLAHAWVEVEGSVVNDLPRVNNFYDSLASY